MQVMNEEIVRELKETIPGFIRSVDYVVQGKADMVLVTVAAFAGEAELLYQALCYAYRCGVEVRFAPQVKA
jgi:hypothetical protein